MRSFRKRKQWQMWALPTRISVIFTIIGLLGLMVSISTILIQSSVSTDIEKKIDELEKIKDSLSTLHDYVDSQQTSLKTISAQKIELEKEREKIQNVLVIDKKQLDALLEYQIIQRKDRAWNEIAISFFIGVLSSSVVTFSTIALQKWLRKYKSPECETQSR